MIITAAAMVVLMGICAIVVDLGVSWMLRRQEQNAADPGALAAARYLPESGIFVDGSPEKAMAVQAACFYARENGFFPAAADNNGCVPANDPDGATLAVNAPPVGSIAGDFEGFAGYVQVVISRTHDSFFGRVLSASDPVVTTDAVVANTDGNANSSSLVALDPGCTGTGGGKISGNGAIVKIVPAPGVAEDGGYVHVNSSCTDHPDGSPSSCTNGSGDLKVDSATLITPHAYVYGTCGASGDVCLPGPPPSYLPADCSSEPVTEGAGRIGDPLSALRPPSIDEVNAAYGVVMCPGGDPSEPDDTAGCDLRTNKCDDDGTPACELEPGVYYGGWRITSGVDVKLEPGI
ncbi:MAG TPA: pilus assembly protein TadG-related protein, partial [Thermomicrobiales bacterium]|nr:pilus assembly protein TadG-related protein [Thermomicrobiales bacterium]